MAPPRLKSFDSKWAIAQSCTPLAVARVVAVPKAIIRTASRRWYKMPPSDCRSSRRPCRAFVE